MNRADMWYCRRHSSASSDSEGNGGNTHIIKISLGFTEYYSADTLPLYF